MDTTSENPTNQPNYKIYRENLDKNSGILKSTPFGTNWEEQFNTILKDLLEDCDEYEQNSCDIEISEETANGWNLINDQKYGNNNNYEQQINKPWKTYEEEIRYNKEIQKICEAARKEGDMNAIKTMHVKMRTIGVGTTFIEETMKKIVWQNILKSGDKTQIEKGIDNQTRDTETVRDLLNTAIRLIDKNIDTFKRQTEKEIREQLIVENKALDGRRNRTLLKIRDIVQARTYRKKCV